MRGKSSKLERGKLGFGQIPGGASGHRGSSRQEPCLDEQDRGGECPYPMVEGMAGITLERFLLPNPETSLVLDTAA